MMSPSMVHINDFHTFILTPSAHPTQPFGFDLATSEELAEAIGRLLGEEHLYRIDHYLGKELVQVWIVVE